MIEFQSDAAPAVSQITNRQRFKTVEGHCYVLEEMLVITHDRNMTLAQAFETSRTRYLKIGVSLIIAILALAYSFVEFCNDEFYVAAAYLTLGIGSGLISKSEISKSMVVFIEKKHIINAQYYGSKFGRRNSGFEVVYAKDFQVRTTEILLPKPKNSGKPNTQKALELMDDLLH